MQGNAATQRNASTRQDEQSATDELAIRELVARGETHRATEIALRAHGREIAAWLARVCRNAQDADEAYSVFLEGLWRGLSRFRWECSLRTWLYCLARAAIARVARRHEAFGSVMEGCEPPDSHTRSATHPWLTTNAKTQFARLRERLTDEERLLLSLRVDRQMNWLEIARVSVDEHRALDEPTLRARAAALRKRFERLKERLRTMGLAEGLIPVTSDGNS